MEEEKTSLKPINGSDNKVIYWYTKSMLSTRLIGADTDVCGVQVQVEMEARSRPTNWTGTLWLGGSGSAV